MTRTIDMSQVSSRGKSQKYTSILHEVQGEAAIGDTILLRDGAFTITSVGPTYPNKTGFTETQLCIKAQG